MYDAIVVGGGIVGAATAHQLVERGQDTLLVDRRDEGRATDAGAGILSPATSSRSDSDDWFGLATAAFQYYPSLIAELESKGASATGYDRCGLLKVAVSDDELESFERTSRRVEERMRTGGFPDPDRIERLSPADARDRFPPLATCQGALYFEQAARVDGQLLTKAMRAIARDAGLTELDASVDRLVLDEDSIAGVRTADGTTHATRTVVIAGGAWSGTFGDQLGVRLPVSPQRGQIIHLGVSSEKTGSWPAIGAFRGHYIVPRVDGRVAVGATRESGVGFDPHPTADGVREVLAEAIRVAPGLGDATLEEVRVGLRPASADGLPILGAIPDVDGAYVATGHGSTGLQLGPYSGKLVADLVVGKEPDVDRSAFDPTRFGSNS